MNNPADGFNAMIDFLRRLQDNNSKSWMDTHRKEYYRIRNFFVTWLDQINLQLASVDPDYYDTPGKKGINRINNNLLYHPSRPVYKDHFGAGLDQLSKQGDFYVEVNTQDVLFGGGYWHPDPKSLRSIRDAIDYNGSELLDILNDPLFKKRFGGLEELVTLSRAPRGFTEDHPHIELIKRTAFAVSCRFSHADLMHQDFDKLVVAVYMEMLPFRRYLRQAISV